MNMLEDIVGSGLYFTLVAATAALPLLVIVLMVDLTVGRRMAPAFRSLLWTIVAVRLLIPIGLPHTLGVPNLWWAVFEGGSPHEAQGSTHSTIQRKADSPPVIPGTVVMGATGADLIMPPPRVDASPAPRVVLARAWDWQTLIAWGILLLWSIGAFAILARAVIGSLRFAARLRRIPIANDPNVTGLLNEVCRTMLIGHAPRVKYLPRLSAPALFGCVRPTLCLPETQQPLSRDELRMILIHELAHLVRYDGYVAWLLIVVQAVHWFNPLAWFVTRQVAHTRELACDEAVRRFTAARHHSIYGDLIIRFAAARPSVNLGLVGLWFARPIRGLKSRVEACTAQPARRWRVPRLLSVLVVAIVACLGFTDRAPSKVVEPPLRPQLIPASPEVVAAAEAAVAQHLDPRPESADTIEERDYDVALALTRLAEADPEADPLRWLLTHIRPDGEKFPKPALVVAEQETGRITLRMSRHEHAAFADALEGINRSGPWQVDVEVHFLRVANLEMLGDIPWEKTSYALPSDARQESWPPESPSAAGDSLISMASTSTSHGSFTVMVQAEQMQRALAIVNRDRRNKMLTAPRVTLYNGTGGMVRDESYTPFVTGIARPSDPGSPGPKPVISVLSEGSRLELHGNVVDADTLELSCRAIFTEIESVAEGRVPGTNHVVQVPNVNQVIIQARACRFARGQSLIVPSIARLRDGGQPVESLCFALTPSWSRATAPRHDATAEPTTYIDETSGSP